MRQIFVHVPRGHGTRVLEAARRCDGRNLSLTEAVDGQGEQVDLALLHIENDRVGPLLEDLQEVPALRISMIPSDALALYPPRSEVPTGVRDATPRSAFEIYLAGIRSIGGWTSFIGYAFAGGVLVWLGLATDTVFLLVGAMLIAPFASPAMNTAVATARGDSTLLWRSLLRYGAALLCTVAAAAALSLIFQHTITTELMLGTVKVSIAAVLLPLAAGGAGALFLSQPEGSSLVSGAGSGLLIAASLAPPAGVVGMALVGGATELLPAALFLLALQLVGINLAATAVFRFYELSTSGPRFGTGNRWVTILGVAASLAGAGALLAWQFISPPAELQRATVESRLQMVVTRALDEAPGVAPVEVDVRFVPARNRSEPTVLVVAHVRRESPEVALNDELRERLTDAIGRAIVEHDATVQAVVSISFSRQATQ